MHIILYWEYISTHTLICWTLFKEQMSKDFISTVLYIFQCGVCNETFTCKIWWKSPFAHLFAMQDLRNGSLFFLICYIKLESNKLRKVAGANFLKRLWWIKRARKVPNMVQKTGFRSFDKSLIYSWGRFPRIWNYLMVF